MEVSNEGDKDNTEGDILLVDEPTNHLDVIDVAWTKKYFHSPMDVTATIVFIWVSSTTAPST